MKTTVNTEIEAYKKMFVPKEHENELLKIIDLENNITDQDILDIGCASGSFISLMSLKYPSAKYAGFDISTDLNGPNTINRYFVTDDDPSHQRDFLLFA